MRREKNGAVQKVKNRHADGRREQEQRTANDGRHGQMVVMATAPPFLPRLPAA